MVAEDLFPGFEFSGSIDPEEGPSAANVNVLLSWKQTFSRARSPREETDVVSLTTPSYDHTRVSGRVLSVRSPTRVPGRAGSSRVESRRCGPRRACRVESCRCGPRHERVAPFRPFPCRSYHPPRGSQGHKTVTPTPEGRPVHDVTRPRVSWTSSSGSPGTPVEVDHAVFCSTGVSDERRKLLFGERS